MAPTCAADAHKKTADPKVGRSMSPRQRRISG